MALALAAYLLVRVGASAVLGAFVGSGTELVFAVVLFVLAAKAKSEAQFDAAAEGWCRD